MGTRVVVCDPLPSVTSPILASRFALSHRHARSNGHMPWLTTRALPSKRDRSRGCRGEAVPFLPRPIWVVHPMVSMSRKQKFTEKRCWISSAYIQHKFSVSFCFLFMLILLRISVVMTQVWPSQTLTGLNNRSRVLEKFYYIRNDPRIKCCVLLWISPKKNGISKCPIFPFWA